VNFDATKSYSLETMLPSDTHCGTLPRRLLDIEVSFCGSDLTGVPVRGIS
jgi:hypothetical protein